MKFCVAGNRLDFFLFLCTKRVKIKHCLYGFTEQNSEEKFRLCIYDNMLKCWTVSWRVHGLLLWSSMKTYKTWLFSKASKAKSLTK